MSTTSEDYRFLELKDWERGCGYIDLEDRDRAAELLEHLSKYLRQILLQDEDR